MRDVLEPGRLAGIIELTLARTSGPTRAYMFDPHRLAMPCWAIEALRAGGPVLVLTMDRHFDLVAPVRKPAVGMSIEAVDHFARWSLDARNVDHILASMDAGLVSHCISIARASPQGAVSAPTYGDHRLVRAKTVEALALDTRTTESREALELIEASRAIVLDVDLDCFTSPSDVDPSTILPWPRAVIEAFVVPAGSEAFWNSVLSKTVALTLAREPKHCGGVVASAPLLREVCEVLFNRLLGVDLP